MSGAGVADALESLGHIKKKKKKKRGGGGWGVIDMGRDVAAKLVEAAPDVVFNALHGTPGEDGFGAGHARPDGSEIYPFGASSPR